MGKFGDFITGTLNPIAGLAAPVLGLISQNKQRKHEQRLNQQTIEHQQALAEYSYSKDLEMWEKANAYNAPTAQMERLKSAGLNPRLIYGSSSGGASGTAAQTMPKYQAPRPEYRYSMGIDPLSILGAYQDFRQKNAEIDLLKEQKRISRANAFIKEWMTSMRSKQRVVGGDLFGKGAEIEIVKSRPFQELFDYQLQSQDTMNQKREHEINRIDSQKELLDKQIEWYMYEMFGKLGLGAVNTILNNAGKLGKAAKATKGVTKGALPDWKWQRFER